MSETKDQDNSNIIRLNALNEKLEAIKSAQKPDAPDQEAEDKSLGLRAGTELVAAIAAGCALGYGVDQWLGTKPFGLICLLLLGVVTGFVNVWRTTQKIGHAVGYKNLGTAPKERLGKDTEIP